mgnify:CR=1 FL=1
MSCQTCVTPDLCFSDTCETRRIAHPRRWHFPAIVFGVLVVAVSGLSGSALIMLEFMGRLARALQGLGL